MSMRHLLAAITLLFALLIITAHANTEKVIFLAPQQADFPVLDLTLDALTPADPKLRTSLPVAFPTTDHPNGRESWYLLRELTLGQRHEVRVCWAATQSTNFRLDVFDISELLANPELFAASSQAEVSLPLHPAEKRENALLLRIQAAADFFTTDKSRMRDPPPVEVDIILDPYFANIFPKSLLATAGYIVCLAVGSWFISGTIWTRLQSITGERDKDHTE
jgi:hypothetical protein